MRLEQVERRVLGAVSFLDATTNLRVRSPLAVEANGVRFVRNLSGYYVIFQAPNFEAYVDSFLKQPVEPEPGSVALESVPIELKVMDPQGRYLPRRSVIHLPLDPATQKPNQGAWLFEAINVQLFPSPVSGTVPGWAIIRATIREEGQTNRLPWALIRVKRVGQTKLLATGLADQRGEALVPVPGLPVTTSDAGTGTVLTSEIAVSLEVVFDTRVKKVRDPEDIGPVIHLPEDYIPNPAELETGQPPDFLSSTSTANLASGREHRAELTVKLT